MAFWCCAPHLLTMLQLPALTTERQSSQLRQSDNHTPHTPRLYLTSTPSPPTPTFHLPTVSLPPHFNYDHSAQIRSAASDLLGNTTASFDTPANRHALMASFTLNETLIPRIQRTKRHISGDNFRSSILPAHSRLSNIYRPGAQTAHTSTHTYKHTHTDTHAHIQARTNYLTYKQTYIYALRCSIISMQF